MARQHNLCQTYFIHTILIYFVKQVPNTKDNFKIISCLLAQDKNKTWSIHILRTCEEAVDKDVFLADDNVLALITDIFIFKNIQVLYYVNFTAACAEIIVKLVLPPFFIFLVKAMRDTDHLPSLQSSYWISCFMRSLLQFDQKIFGNRIAQVLIMAEKKKNIF